MSLAPTISVVMPAYKVAPYIGETLASVCAQSFADYEVIVVNDGSPDTAELERVLAPFRSRISYLKQENRGASVARNRGLQAARGELIAFLDADDLWLPNYLAEQYAFIQRGPYDLVYADALLFGDSPQAGRTFMETAPSSGPVTFRSLIRGECNVITSGVVARRQLICEVGLFDEQLRNAQDFDLWVRLVRHGARVAYQRKVLLRYRVHEDSLSGDELNRIKRELRVYAKIASTPDLTPEERAEVARVSDRLNAELAFSTGKLALARGDFAAAQAAFKQANQHEQSWRRRATLPLLYLAPHLLQRLYLRHARSCDRSPKSAPEDLTGQQ